MKMYINTNSITSQNNYSIKTSFKSKNKEEKKKQFEYLQKKRDYLDSKTEGLTGLSLLALVISIPLHGFKAGLKEKMTTKEKWGAGLILLSLALSLIADFKKIKLSREYDKKMNK